MHAAAPAAAADGAADVAADSEPLSTLAVERRLAAALDGSMTLLAETGARAQRGFWFFWMSFESRLVALFLAFVARTLSPQPTIPNPLFA